MCRRSQYKPPPQPIELIPVCFFWHSQALLLTGLLSCPTGNRRQWTTMIWYAYISAPRVPWQCTCGLKHEPGSLIDSLACLLSEISAKFAVHVPICSELCAPRVQRVCLRWAHFIHSSCFLNTVTSAISLIALSPHRRNPAETTVFWTRS